MNVDEQIERQISRLRVNPKVKTVDETGPERGWQGRMFEISGAGGQLMIYLATDESMSLQFGEAMHVEWPSAELAAQSVNEIDLVMAAVINDGFEEEVSRNSSGQAFRSSVSIRVAGGTRAFRYVNASHAGFHLSKEVVLHQPWPKVN